MGPGPLPPSGFGNVAGISCINRYALVCDCAFGARIFNYVTGLLSAQHFLKLFLN